MMKEPSSTSQSPRAETSARTPKRRANSCVPCRVSKSRCNGGVPCSTCQKKRQKPRCYYRNPFARDSEIASVGLEHNSDEALEAATSQDTSLIEDFDGLKKEDILVFPHKGFYGAFSLPRCVDEFKTLLPSEGRIQEIIDTIQSTQVFRTEPDPDGRLIDLVSFEQSIDEPSRYSSVLGENNHLFSKALGQLYVRCLAVEHLLDSGMVAQAWTIFAGLVKEAELIGLDQDTSMSDCEEENEHDPEPHRRVWWLLVELDTRLSFLLGRRPNISPSHGVCKPTVAASRHEERELQQSVAEFSQYMLEVLSHAHEKAETHSGPAEGRHTLHADLAQLNHLPSKLPGLPQNAVTDPDLWLSIAARQIDRQLFVMVLHCQILRKGGSSRNLGKASFKNYYKEILDCARAVTDLFDSFFNLDPSQSASCWPRCLGVYCAAAILGIALLRQEIDLDTDSSRVERMMQIFQKLTTIAPDAGTARLAVRSLGEIVNGIKELQRGQNPNSEPYVPPPISNPATMPPDDRQSSTTSSVAAGKAAPDRRIRVKRQNSSTFEGDVRGDKKRRFDTEPMVYNDSAPAGPRSAWQAGQEHPYPPEGVSVFNDIAAASFSEPSAHGSFSRQSFPTSASTSFAGRDQIEYSTVGYAPAHTSANDEYHAARWWVHPPMAYHPPMYDDGWQHQDPGFDMLATSNGQHGFYAAPSAPAMNHPLPMQDDIRGGQQVGLTNLSTASPSRGETLIIGDPQLAPPGGSTQVPSHASGRPQDPPFYNPPAETYQNMDHSLSSPGIAEGATHPEGVLGRLVPPSRRQSATDIRQQQQQQQQQLAPWSMEVQATVPNTQKGDGPDRTQSPQRVGILSPVSEADSSMPRVVAAQGNASMVQKHPSQILVQNPESESYPGSRRHSTAHVEEVSLPERAPLGGRLAEAVEENANQQAWARQAQMQGMYSAPTAGPYRVDMPDYTIPYDQRFHGHLHPPQVITTGAFHGDSGGHRWWSG